jgi:hypothetical protein
VAIWGDSHRFRRRGGIGGDGGPPGQLDLARGGLVRWHRAAAMAAVSGARAGRRNRGRERACEREGRGDRGEAGRQGGSYPLGRQRRRRGSPRHRATVGSPRSCLPTKEEDDRRHKWAGPGAAICCSARRMRERGERTWAGFGQERKRDIFFSTLFSILWF